MRRSIWIVLALLPTVASAAVKVEVRADGELTAAEVFAERSGEPAAALRTVTESGSASLNLESGEWILRAEAAGYWSMSETLAVEQPSEQEVALFLWPSGTLSGRVRGSVDEVLPASLDLVWNASPKEDREIPGASAVCPVTEGGWKCELPAGRLDLFIGAPGFIHQYRWDVIVPGNGLTELREAVVLRRGSVVRGWVTAEDRGSVDGALVELAPRTAGTPPRKETADRIEGRKLTAEATDRGFFQVDGIAPGAYVVTASKGGYASARASVQVRENQAVEINDPPLVLHSPRSLEIYVDPPTPPIGEAWMAELSQVDRHGGTLIEKIEGIVPPGSAWRLEGVSDGRYYLDVRSTADRPEPGAGVPAWHRETIEVTASTAQVFVTVPAIAVSGHLTLGDEPIQGELIFGGQHGLLRRSIITDAEGKFSSWLPRAGLWDIDVAVETPPIETKVQKEVEHGSELEIMIPDTRLSGQVIDERGDPAPEAIVYLRTQGRRQQISADASGAFEAAGLPIGPLSLMAADHQRKSEVQQVTLEEGVDVPEIFLVVRPTLTRTGRVVAPNGAGVAGARIGAFVVEDAVNPLPESGVTDEEGRFELELPGHAQNLLLTVAAPGFAFRAFRASAREEPLLIPVSQEGGTLTLQLPETYSPRRWDSPLVALIHDHSGVSYLVQVMNWAVLQGQEVEWPTRIVAPSMEPGNYSACWVGAGQSAALVAGNAVGLQCVSGNLSNSGELTLALRETEPAEMEEGGP